MYSLDDQILMAYADDQLDPLKKAEVEAALANNPEAQETVQLFQETRHLLGDLYEAPLHQPVPGRLLATLTTVPKVHHLHPPKAWYSSTKVPLSLAATVAVCAIGLGTGIFNSPSQENRPELLDQLLSQALETQASGSSLTVSSNGMTREILPLLTFQDSQQRFCREFETRLIQAFGKNTTSVGMACREGEGWQVQVMMNRELLVQDNPEISDYQPASGGMAMSPYDALADRIMSSMPTTPAEEAALLQSGWQKAKP